MALDKVVCCENNHRFSLGISGDGYRNCPECNQLLKEVPADVTKGEPFTLQYLWQAFNKKKEPKTSARNLSIDVEMHSGKMQLKLRAIAKHAGALADELDAIDNLKECEACGSYKSVTESLIDDDTNNVISAIVKCDDCGNELPNQLKETTLSIGIASSETGEVIADALKDLPSRLEGSE